MLKNMRLNLKTVSGCAVVLVLAAALGTLVVWDMKKAEIPEGRLAGRCATDMSVTDNIERNPSDAGIKMLADGLSLDKHHLEKATKNLNEAKKYLDETKQLFGTYKAQKKDQRFGSENQ